MYCDECGYCDERLGEFDTTGDFLRQYADEISVENESGWVLDILLNDICYKGSRDDAVRIIAESRIENFGWEPPSKKYSEDEDVDIIHDGDGNILAWRHCYE